YFELCPLNFLLCMTPPSTVGVIGLGIMGSAISANLIRAGYRVVGYDVLAKRRHDHRRAGGEIARTCRDVAKRADVVICSLPSAEAFRRTTADLAKSPGPPELVIETSTLPEQVKQEARRELAACGTTLLDCPLSGTGPQARAKRSEEHTSELQSR